MQKRIKDFLEENHMIQKGDSVAAGLSGGADSVCLLLVLKKMQKELGFALTAVHVEHGIRGAESLADAEFARDFCERQKIPFLIYHVDAPAHAKKTHQTLEEAARELRYQCFSKACEACGANKIAVAHHGDDCAETMLFHLSRGTGIRGLCGIAPVREQVIRPLLAVTRREIEAYLQKEGQPYRIDSTNLDLAYSRNRIRHEVLPQLTQINPKAVEHMVRTSGYLEEVCDYLEASARTLAEEKKCVVAIPETDGMEGAVKILKEEFESIHAVLQRILIHHILGDVAGSRKDITDRHIRAVAALFEQQVGKSTDLPCQMKAKRTYDGVVIAKGKGKKLCSKGKTDAEAEYAKLLPLPGELIVSGEKKISTRIFQFNGNFKEIPEKTYTKWFDYDKIKNTVFVRYRRSGDYFQTMQTGGKKKLKNFFIDAKVPQEKRDDILLLADDSHILWIIGYRISEFYKVTEQTKHVLEVCVNGGRVE